MTDPDPIVSFQRQALVWFGSVLLHYGHVVEVPDGDRELVVHKKTPRRIHIEIHEQIDISKPRTPIAKIADLGDAFPDAVVLLEQGHFKESRIRVIPVQSTRDEWITEGRYYALPTTSLVTFSALDAWLKKLP